MSDKPSYTQVAYELRPNKQVERRMIIDALMALSGIGYSLSQYQYTGMVSIFFTDYILFHKYLGINNMVSVERYLSDGRAKFNKPFGDTILKLESGLIGQYISTLSPDIPHLLWLDYDYPLSSSVIADVVKASAQLPEKSVLLITVDTEFKTHRDKESETNIDLETPTSRFAHYQESSGHFFDPQWTLKDFTSHTKFHKITIQILSRAVNNGLSGQNIIFIPIFNFLYADGHRMLSYGGVMGTRKDKKMISKILQKKSYVRLNPEEPPFKIDIPILTRREKQYLDSFMPCDDNYKPKHFSLPDEKALMNYKEVYRFYPTYIESLV